MGNLHANGNITLGENSNPVSGYVLTRGNYFQDGGDVGLAVDDLTNDRVAEGKVFILFLVRKRYLYGSFLYDTVLDGLVMQHTGLSLFVCQYCL